MMRMDAQPTGALRPRIIAAAIELTTRSGWATVTMSRLAEEVGVSRQTIYNEVGSKQALAEAMVLDELGRFLAVVADAFDAHEDDLVAAIHAAVQGVLEMARDSVLLRASVSATHGASSDLLPLLTTRADTLLTTAKEWLTVRVKEFTHPFDDRQLTCVIDVIVRTVLSHVMEPSQTPERTADDLAWIAARVLDSSEFPEM